jgi:imidazolonepropionase-like amidohydrolase
MILHVLLAATIVEHVRVEVGNGTVIEDASVLFDGRIRAVGKVSAPAGATVIDGRGQVLSPGFVSALTQLGVVEVGLEAATVDVSMQGHLNPGFRVDDGFNPRSIHIPVQREEGVTSALCVPEGGLLAGTGAWFDLTGRLEDRAQGPVAMFGTLTGGSADQFEGARGALWLRLREAFADARFYAQKGSAYDSGSARPLALSPHHLRALVPVTQGKLPLVLAVSRAADILQALRFAKEEGVRLTLAGAAEAAEVAPALAAANVPVLLLPSAQGPGTFDMLRARDEDPARLVAAGVQLVLVAGESRRLRQEAGIAVAYGLPHAEALRAITLTPAQVFGRGREVGSVEVGKRANLVLWSGDPLEISSVAQQTWIDGTLYGVDHRQRQLAQRYLPVTSP